MMGVAASWTTISRRDGQAHRRCCRAGRHSIAVCWAQADGRATLVARPTAVIPIGPGPIVWLLIGENRLTGHRGAAH